MLVATHYTVSLDIGKGVYVVRNKDAPIIDQQIILHRAAPPLHSASRRKSPERVAVRQSRVQ